MDLEWYFISYNLPSEPSRARVKVWRRLKNAGAINIQQSLWVLPKLPPLKDNIDRLKLEVTKENGSFYLVEGRATEGGDKLIERFKAESEIEYEELLEHCNSYIQEMEKETYKRNYTYIELEENDEELKKLIKWFEKIKKRDFFKCSGGEKIRDMLKECTASFERFSLEVYKTNRAV